MRRRTRYGVAPLGIIPDVTSDIPATSPSDPDPRLAIIEAGRRDGLAEAQIARALALDVRSVNRMAGSRRAWAARQATPAQAGAEDLEHLDVEPPTATTPAPVPAARRAPVPTPPRRRRGYDLGYFPEHHERLGNRTTEGDGSLPWSPEQLRATTERLWAERAAKETVEYGSPRVAVRFADGSYATVPVPIPDAAPDDHPTTAYRQPQHRESL